MSIDHVYVAMFGQLPGMPTGLAMSVLRRAEAFAEAGISTTILVDYFSRDYDEQVHELIRRGRIGGRISVRYMYHDLAGDEVRDPEQPYHSPLGTQGWSYRSAEGRNDVLLGTFEGEYRHRVMLRERRVVFIDELDAGTFATRTWYDGGGSACRKDLMGPQGKPRVVRFLDRRGGCWLEESRDEATQKTLGLELYPRTERSTACSDLVEVFLYWMRNVVLSGQAGATIISEYGTRRRALSELEDHFDARVIYTVHNNHLTRPYRYGARIRPEMADLFAHVREYRHLVVLTDEQRQDLWKSFGRLESISTVPHFVPASTRDLPRDQRKVVMVGRFEEIKGQVAAVRAFRKVVDAVPDARLVFYGRGGAREAMAKEIADQGLSANVSIEGFSPDADAVFLGAGMSIVASDYEGFCLSLAESMAAGCVPAAYDIKYGPREMISNGVNGFLVERGNETELADALILGLTDPAYLDRLSSQGRHITERFSRRRFIEDWKDVLSR